MADIKDINLLDYKDLSEAESKWLDFYKDKLSSFYSNDDINSSQFLILIRAFSKFLGSIDTVYESSLDNISLETVLNEAVYNNFGFLLYRNNFNLSPYEYKIFLRNLINILFEGLRTSDAGLKIFPSLTYAEIILDIYEPIRNESKDFSGLGHTEALFDNVDGSGIQLNGKTHSTDYYSFKDLNDFFVSARYDWSSKNLFYDPSKIIYTVITLVSSAIVKPKMRFIVDESSQGFSKTYSEHESACLYRSYDGFSSIFQQFCIDEGGIDEGLNTCFFYTDDEYSIDSIQDIFEVDLTHKERPSINYNITQDTTNDLNSKVTESLRLETHQVTIQEGLIYGPQVENEPWTTKAYGGVYYDPRCLAHLPPFCDTPSEDFYYDHLAFFDDDGPNKYGENWRPEVCGDDDELELKYTIFFSSDDAPRPWLNGGSYQILFGEGYVFGEEVHATSANNTFYPECQIMYNESLFYESPLQLTNDVFLFVNENTSFGNDLIFGDFFYGSNTPYSGTGGYDYLDAEGFYV